MKSRSHQGTLTNELETFAIENFFYYFPLMKLWMTHVGSMAVRSRNASFAYEYSSRFGWYPRFDRMASCRALYNRLRTKHASSRIMQDVWETSHVAGFRGTRIENRIDDASKIVPQLVRQTVLSYYREFVREKGDTGSFHFDKVSSSISFFKDDFTSRRSKSLLFLKSPRNLIYDDFIEC